jgi:hypothetical protein
MDDAERFKLLMLAHGLDTRLARIEQRLDELAGALRLHKAPQKRRPTVRRVAREIAYANPTVGQVWRVRDGGPCYLTTEIDAAGLQLRLVPARWNAWRRAAVPVQLPGLAERWVDFGDLRPGYDYVGCDARRAQAAP